MSSTRKLTTRLATLSAIAGGLVFASAPALAAAPETPHTVEANPIGATTATLHGVLNPGNVGDAGSYAFSYEPSSSLAPECGMPGTLAPSSPVADAGVKGEAKTVALTGLEPNEEYAFCIVAYSLTAEPSYGAAVPFKTLPAPPAALTEPATGIKAEEARLEAVVNPNNEPTSCSFQYGTDGSLATDTEVPCEQATIEGGGQGVGLTVPALKPATTYYYRVIAENEQSKTEGKPAEGAIEQFKTALHLLAPETEAASAITGTTARLNGTLKPAATKLKYEFEYNTGASCEGGKTTPEGESEGEVSAPVTGLEGSSEYAVCMVAINEGGETAVGAQLTFKTPATEPVVVAETSSGITPFAVTLQAEINPEGQPTTSCVFEYGETVTEHKTSCEPATLTGASPQSATLAVSELKSATNYHYRVVVKNATGKAEGAEEEFTTLTAEAPSIAGESIIGLSATGVSLGAQVTPDYQETTYSFEYSTKEASPGVLEAPITTISGVKALPPASGELPASVVLGDLTPDTTYYYRATATNSTGTTTDNTVQSFTTPVLALVRTGEAQNITLTTATLSGTVNPEGVETTYYFEYVSEAQYQAALVEGAVNPYAAGEATAPAKLMEPGGGPDTGDEPQAVGPIPAVGLLPGVTYHYRVVAQNESEGKIESSYGQDETFTTLPGTPPIVSTGGASNVGQNAATLSGTVDTNSLQTAYGFEIGTESGDYGPATGLGSLGGAVIQTVSVTLSKLQPGTTYYYRVTASNADGRIHGEAETFTTPGFPTLLVYPAVAPLLATPGIAFPTETDNTQSPMIAVVSHSVKGRTATVAVRVPVAGKLVATGQGFSKVSKKATGAGTLTIKLHLTNGEAALLAKHRGRKLKVTVKLTFTLVNGAQLEGSVTVLVT